MFFDDIKLTKRKGAALKLAPPIPNTNWQPPTHFPDLTNASVICIDTETKETDFERGPGWARGAGHIVGFSVAARDKRNNYFSQYFPIRHTVEAEYNVDPTFALQWLKRTLETSHIPKVGTNLLYDVGWLTDENIWPLGKLYDVQFAEALLDEYGYVNLEYLARKYLRRHKESDLLYEWCAGAYGGKPDDKQRDNIWRAPPRLVGPYAESDVDLPLQILSEQWVELRRQDLLNLFELECSLIPMLVDIRRAGVTVDINYTEHLYENLANDVTVLYDKLYALTGVRANVNSSDDLSKLFDAAGIDYPRTAKGNPSFQKDFLASLDHPIAKLVQDIREHEKIRGTFLRNYILEGHTGGKLYCQFHPLRSDDSGTMVGRFSSSDPNLQNIPSRTKLGKRVRKAFIADKEQGHNIWRKHDYSQIHYRLLAHYAVGPGSDELRQRYIEDKTTDYHQDVLNNVAPFMGWDITDNEHNAFVRRPIKNVNFGLLYGQSMKALLAKSAAYFGTRFTEQQGKEFFEAYFKGAPYVKPTMKMIGEEVQQNGFVRTILGRRLRFHLWEPAKFGDFGPALPYEAAIREYGHDIRRAFEYRGVNYKLQGSEADVMKYSLAKCYYDGVFNVTGVPRILVHDELGHSSTDTPEHDEAFRYMQHVMETALPLRVPIYVDGAKAPSWGDID